MNNEILIQIKNWFFGYDSTVAFPRRLKRDVSKGYPAPISMGVEIEGKECILMISRIPGIPFTSDFLITLIKREEFTVQRVVVKIWSNQRDVSCNNPYDDSQIEMPEIIEKAIIEFSKEVRELPNYKGKL